MNKELLTKLQHKPKAYSGCEVSILRDLKNPTRQGPEQCAVVDPSLNRQDMRVCVCARTSMDWVFSRGLFQPYSLMSVCETVILHLAQEEVMLSG